LEEAKRPFADNRRAPETTDEGPGRGNRGDEGGAQGQAAGVDRAGEALRLRRGAAYANQQEGVAMRPSAVPPARGEGQARTAAALAETLDKKKGEADFAGYKQRLAGTGDLARSTATPGAEKQMLVITVNVLPLDAETMSRRAAADREKAAAPPAATGTQK
jgi:hypothetical protein